MVTPKLYATLDADERKLWHSHVFEVKSGMLIMPQPSALVPNAAWDKAETAEMEDVVELYGKVSLCLDTDAEYDCADAELCRCITFGRLIRATRFRWASPS